MSTVLAQIDAHFLEQVLWFALLAVPVSVAAMAHVYSPRRIIGPERMAPTDRIGPLWACMLVGLFVWMMVPATYAAARFSQGNPPATQAATGPATQPTLAPGFTAEEGVAISAATGAAVLASLLFANAALRRGGLSRLGFSGRSLRRALLPGVVSVFTVIPMMYVVSGITQWFWELIDLKHREAHPFLEIFQADANPMLRALIAVSAVILAPIFEEMLFRGHFQTAVLYSLRRVFQLDPAPRRFEPVLSPDPATELMHTPADHSQSTVTPISAPPSPWAPAVATRWIAIILTSILFALVHQELWMMPPIFFLSLCLGYTYERTGNLWVPILIHATFNGINVAVFWFRLDH
jgi:membrane protease YdiL (CAAX protease family)